MARIVEAVLLALTETPGFAASPRAPELVSEVKTFLEQRFVGIGPSQIATLESGQAMKDKVLEAVRAAGARLAGTTDGLLVLAFSGHGGVTPTGHTWELHGGPLVDTELAAALASLPAGVEVALISDCCFGAGILRAGLKLNGVVVPLPAAIDELLRSPIAGGRLSRLKTLGLSLDGVRRRMVPLPEDLRAVRGKLRTSVVRWATANAPGAGAALRKTVCLASAALTLSLDGTEKNRFARCLRAVMESSAPPARYDLLDDEMLKLLTIRGESDLEQKQWMVEAEPASAAALPPFAT